MSAESIAAGKDKLYNTGMNKLLSLLTLAVSGIIVFLLFTDVSDYTAFQPKSALSPTPTPLKKNWQGYESRMVAIEGREYNLLVADTGEKQSLGLMNVTDIAPYEGMIFFFSDVSPKTFWNKNTFIDLKIIWMLDDTVVRKSELPSITKSGEIVEVSSVDPVNIVVELVPEK